MVIMKRRSFFALPAALCALPDAPAATTPAVRPFQLGCVTYNTLKDMDLDTVIKTLEAAGFGVVELRTEHKHGVEPTIDAAARAKVKERFAQSKVKLVSYGTTCEFQSLDEGARRKQIDLAKAWVDLAKDTGAVGVKVRPNGVPRGADLGETIKRIGAGLKEVGDYGQSKGIEIWMEVHGGTTQEPKNAAAILAAANHPNVFACWNSNPTDVQNGSVKAAFDLLGPKIRSCHINELTNDYPWKEFFGLLKASGYKRWTLCEVAESKEPVRFLQYYRAVWEQMTA
jgi:sugar phosphate isomerase/epimerase